MAGMGSFNIRGLTELQREMEKLQDPNAFVEACVKELAARLLRLVIKRTPVGDYSGQSYTCETGFSPKGKKVKGKTRRNSSPGMDSGATGISKGIRRQSYGKSFRGHLRD